jgi:outer membrane lipoprotein SlyB
LASLKKENDAMQASHPDTKSGLHPLLTAAAISVSVFSAVGVGALTGLIPSSIGSSSIEAPALQAPAPPPSIPESKVEAMPAAEPAKKAPVKKAVARPAQPAAVQPAVYRDFPEPAHVGTIESVREVKQAGDGSGLGAVAGGVAGAVLGKQLGKGSGKTVMTVLGAAGGAYAGHQVEKQVRAAKHWEIAVRMDDGSLRTLSTEAEHSWQTGDRVRIVEGRLQPA